MITIGAGKFRSRKIKVPSYLDVPTKSIVRMGIANALGDSLKGAFVLDLFAGSGAMGIEFISRGSNGCIFVDKEKEAFEVIEENLSLLKIENSKVVQSDYFTALESFKKENLKFSIIFVDPPYKDFNAYEKSVNFIIDNDLLTEDGILVLEYEKEPFMNIEFPKEKKYRYGRSGVTIYWRNV